MIVPDRVAFENVIKALIRRIEALERTLDEILSNFRAAEKLEDTVSPAYSLPEHLKAYEADIIRAALKKHSWDKAATAEALGLTPSELSIRIKVYKLGAEDLDSEERMRQEMMRLATERFLKDCLCSERGPNR